MPMNDFNVLTMNAKCFPGTAPLLARLGERVRIRRLVPGYTSVGGMFTLLRVRQRLAGDGIAASVADGGMRGAPDHAADPAHDHGR